MNYNFRNLNPTIVFECFVNGNRIGCPVYSAKTGYFITKKDWKLYKIPMSYDEVVDLLKVYLVKENL